MTSTDNPGDALHSYGSEDCPYIYNSSVKDNFKMELCTANGYRLPTKSVWEILACALNPNTYAGSNNIEDVAWYSANSRELGEDNIDYGTHEVGLKAPNAWGIYDMSGNVSEWCWDLYPSGTARTRRGGDWVGVESTCRIDRLLNCGGGGTLYHLGIRLYRSY